MQSTTGRSRVANAILKASKKNGELANCGVMGRLGDLATIDSQYDVAVSTACGMLDHIVVQTTAGTQKCLVFLRKHNLGRASFVPLDKMKKGAHDRAVETPEGAPRLFDLINPGHISITPALYLAVGNTLVAPDLETATRWAYDFGKRWRVVTVDGKLIETSGTMSGGGKSVQKGKMKLSVSSTQPLLSELSNDSVHHYWPTQFHFVSHMFRMEKRVLPKWIQWLIPRRRTWQSWKNRPRLPKRNSKPAVPNVVNWLRRYGEW